MEGTLEGGHVVTTAVAPTSPPPTRASDAVRGASRDNVKDTARQPTRRSLLARGGHSRAINHFGARKHHLLYITRASQSLRNNLYSFTVRSHPLVHCAFPGRVFTHNYMLTHAADC